MRAEKQKSNRKTDNEGMGFLESDTNVARYLVIVAELQCVCNVIDLCMLNTLTASNNMPSCWHRGFIDFEESCIGC